MRESYLKIIFSLTLIIFILSTLTLVVYENSGMTYEFKGYCNAFFVSRSTFGPVDGWDYTWNFTEGYPYYGNKSFSITDSDYFDRLFPGIELAFGVTKNPKNTTQFTYHRKQLEPKGFIMEIQRAESLPSDELINYNIEIEHLSLNVTIIRSNSTETHQILEIKNQRRIVRETNSSFYTEFYIAMFTIEYTLSKQPELSFYLAELSWSPYTIELDPINTTIIFTSVWDVSFFQPCTPSYEYKGSLQNIILHLTQINSTTINMNGTVNSQVFDSGRLGISGFVVPYPLIAVVIISGSIAFLLVIRLKFMVTQAPNRKILPVTQRKQ